MKNIKKELKILTCLMIILILCVLSCALLMILKNPQDNDNLNFDDVIQSVVSIDNYNDGRVVKKGSGFIYKTDTQNAYIITNNHVIEDATEIKVYTSEDESVEGKILGHTRYFDIAVITIKNNGYKSLKLDTKNDMKAGDTIYAIGTPLSNEFYNSISSGIISNESRIRIENNSGNDTLMNMIQMSIVISPGNSGGPILNDRLEVIGICTSSINTENLNGISFAVPISSIIEKLDELEKGKIILPKIGDIEVIDVNDSEKLYSEGLIDKTKELSGVVVIKDDEETSLKKGDIIKKINNKEIKDINYYELYLNQYKKNDNIKIEITRDNKKKVINVKLK